MHRRFRFALAFLVSAAFLIAGWGAISPAMAAPICMGCADAMSDMPGMGHPADPTKEKSNSECMIKAGCYATCAKLPTRDLSSSSPAFVRLAFTLRLAEQFKTITPSPEPSPPKTIA